jgi:NDP-sugar pyrophosphorylase family protein
MRRFVLPVGYLGAQIAAYANQAFRLPGCEIICVDTGADTPISHRINRVREHLPRDGSFLLTNGDALFDFDVTDMAVRHRDANAAITLATVATISKYGLVIIKNGRIAGFERQSRVAAYMVEVGDKLNPGFVYTGTCMLHSRALEVIELGASQRFEAELFPKLIAEDTALQYPLDGFWYSIDTPKDLAAVNTGVGADAIFAGPASALKARLEADLMTAGRDRV